MAYMVKNEAAGPVKTVRASIKTTESTTVPETSRAANTFLGIQLLLSLEVCKKRKSNQI